MLILCPYKPEDSDGYSLARELQLPECTATAQRIAVIVVLFIYSALLFKRRGGGSKRGVLVREHCTYCFGFNSDSYILSPIDHT